jgi:hypothetical protein
LGCICCGAWMDTGTNRVMDGSVHATVMIQLLGWVYERRRRGKLSRPRQHRNYEITHVYTITGAWVTSADVLSDRVVQYEISFCAVTRNHLDHYVWDLPKPSEFVDK